MPDRIGGPPKRRGNPRESLTEELRLTMDERIGQRLTSIRREHNLTHPEHFISQEVLSHEVGVALNTFNRIERGVTAAQLPTLVKLASFWEMNVQEMLADIPTPTIEETFNAPRIKRILEGSK